MQKESRSQPAPAAPVDRWLVGLGRGFGGALLFGLPMLMTMEMWQLGFAIDPLRLALLLAATLPLLIYLARFGGLDPDGTWRHALRDAGSAYGIGILTSALILAVFGLLTPEMSAGEIVGKVAVQSVPAAIGALLGRSQLGGHMDEPPRKGRDSLYRDELFLMAVGALYLSLNAAPTEEMVLISYRMTPWHALALIALSVALMHGFVYALEFKGTDRSLPPGTPWWSAFLRFTLPGYALAVLISLYVLWTFGQVEEAALLQVVMAVVVLGFPAAIGAAAARLIL